MNAVGFDLLVTFLEIPAQIRRLGRPAGAVVGNDFAATLRYVEHEAVAADSGGLRLHHGQDGRRTDRRIDGVATGPQHRKSFRGGEGVRGGDGRLTGTNRRSPGKLEITHDLELLLERGWH